MQNKPVKLTRAAYTAGNREFVFLRNKITVMERVGNGACVIHVYPVKESGWVWLHGLRLGWKVFLIYVNFI